MSNTALLVIDMQHGLINGAFRETQTLNNIATLIAQARSAAIPIVYMQHETEHYPPLNYGAETWQIHPMVAPDDGDIVLRKHAADSFYRTPLMQELNDRDVRHLIVTGMQTEMCVDTTCRAAISHGYNVTLVADAHTTGNNAVIDAAQTIAYTNATLADLAHPDHPIRVQATSEIAF